MINNLPSAINDSLNNFVLEHSETDKTDKTNFVDNNDFLQAIFGDLLASERPLLVSFKGNPGTVPKKEWFAFPWNKPSAMALPSDANNYFSLACFKPNEESKYRRTKTQFHELRAIMLDDIGTKVSRDKLTLPPSWLLETSPGNYQAGYILDEPLKDVKAVDQLMNAIINAGLCDPGANGETTRLARLPVAVNGKYYPPFSCKIEYWNPQHKYSIQQLIDGLQLEIINNPTSKKKKASITSNGAVDVDSVYLPRPEKNAVITALMQRNLYKSSLGDGKHDITCPWVGEHTNAVDSGTAYFEPDKTRPIGGYKCLHGHCAERHIRELLQALNITVASARMKPVIRTVNGEIHHVVDAAEQELAKSGKYYQRGNLIVVIVIEPETNRVYIQRISKPALIKALADVATWEKYNSTNGWVRIDPPERHVSVLYDVADYTHLPILEGLAYQPYLRSDGSLVKLSGYDAIARMYGVFNANKFAIPEHPSRVDAENALMLLKNILVEFPFDKESDRSATLAAILTATIRPGLPFAPMFHVRAHAVGSGKSYLCALITAFATSQQGTPTSFPADDEECRKLLLAEFLCSPAVIEFDNMTCDILPHKSLCTALTSEFMSGRILGESKTATVNTRTLILSSGNNVAPIKDMTRRCITINLNPEIEIPAERDSNRPNLITEILEEREHYVSAALTIIRAWIVAGRPMSECKSLAGFKDWSDLCRQSLLWLGCADPSRSIFEAIEEDPDREQLGRLLVTWHAIFGDKPAMIREVIKKSALPINEELKETLIDIAGENSDINRRRLGRWIKQHLGQIVDGLRFVRCSGTTSAERWRIESVLSLSSVSNPTSEKDNTLAEEYRLVSGGE